MLFTNYVYATCQSTGSVDNWQVYCLNQNKAKKTIPKERRKYFINLFVDMDSSTIWTVLRRSRYIKGNDFPFRFGVDEVNDQFVCVSNCDLPDDSEPWTNLNFNGSFLFSCHELNVVLRKIKSKSLSDNGITILFIFHLIFPYIAELVMFHAYFVLSQSVFPLN